MRSSRVRLLALDILVAAATTPLLALGSSTTATTIFLVQGDRVVPVPRPGATVQAAVAALLAGPSAAEAAAGLATEVPAGVTVRGIEVDGHIARVSLSTPFGVAGAGPGDGRDLQLRLAQLVYTVTSVPGVDRVVMLVDGEPVDFLEAVNRPGFRLRGSFTYVGPMRRADFPAFGAKVGRAVLLELPREGARIRGRRIVVAGSADVFEANVVARLVQRGRVLSERPITARCGTGCRGTFRAIVRVPAGVRGRVAVRVFAPSAQDGRPLHLTARRLTVG